MTVTLNSGPLRGAGDLRGAAQTVSSQGLDTESRRHVRSDPHFQDPDRDDALDLLEVLPTDHLPEPGTCPGPFLCPHPGNAPLAGRTGDLMAMAAILKDLDREGDGPAVVTAGLGGVGKTRLALEFARRYGRWFAGGVFYVNCADPDAVEAQVARFAPALGFQGEDNEAAQAAHVAALWDGFVPRLLIFDNCEDEALVRRWRPRTGAARVLLTARRSQWSDELGLTVHPVNVLSQEDSVGLLLEYRPDLEDRRDILSEIAIFLGGLPLALTLAGGYLRAGADGTGGPPAQDGSGDPVRYLRVLRAKALEHRSMTMGCERTSPAGHERHVAHAFATSLNRLTPEDAEDRLPHDRLAQDRQSWDRLVRELLVRAACFAPDEPISPELIKLCAPGPNDLGVDQTTAGTMAARALRRLTQLGLVRQDDGGGLTVHPLVATLSLGHEDIRTRYARQDVERIMARTAESLNETGRPQALQHWFTHLLHIARQAGKIGSPEAGRLWNEIGIHKDRLGDFTGARSAFERAIVLDEAVFGPDHPNLAVRCGNLAEVLRTLGDGRGAREALGRALKIDETHLGPDHPSLAVGLTTLARMLKDEGDLEEARKAAERALAINEVSLGADHVQVAVSLNTLAAILEADGNLAGARDALERPAALFEGAHHVGHPAHPRTLNNLGSLLRRTGDVDGASVTLLRALKIFETHFGADHPGAGVVLQNLGLVFEDLGDWEGAAASYEQALSIAEAAFGPDHPKLVDCLQALANARSFLGQQGPADEATQRAVAIREKTNGAGDP